MRAQTSQFAFICQNFFLRSKNNQKILQIKSNGNSFYGIPLPDSRPCTRTDILSIRENPCVPTLRERTDLYGNSTRPQQISFSLSAGNAGSASVPALFYDSADAEMFLLPSLYTTIKQKFFCITVFIFNKKVHAGSAGHGQSIPSAMYLLNPRSFCTSVMKIDLTSSMFCSTLPAETAHTAAFLCGILTRLPIQTTSVCIKFP